MTMDRVRHAIHLLEQAVRKVEPDLRVALECAQGDLKIRLELDPETGFEVFALGRGSGISISTDCPRPTVSDDRAAAFRGQYRHGSFAECPCCC